MARQAEDYEWTGTHVRGANAACMVKFQPPTDHKPPRWVATLRRGIRPDQIFRATVPYSDGPLVAAKAVAIKADLPHWEPGSVSVTDGCGDLYCVSFRSS
jgi:hypothetical protein